MSDRLIFEALLRLHLEGKGGEEAKAQIKGIKEQAAKLQGELDSTEKGLGKTTAAAGKFGGALLTLGKTVAGYFAVGVIKNFLQSSFEGFARTERQALSAENQIKSLGQAAEGAGFRGFIRQLSDTSGILDDNLVPAMQRALGAFKDYKASTEVVTLASKFAAAGIGDVASNVDAISRFFQSGSARGLVQFGVDIKDSADGTIDLNEGLKALNDAAARVGSGFSDAQRGLEVFRNVVDSAKDSVGELVFKMGEGAKSAGKFLLENVPNALLGPLASQGVLAKTLKDNADAIEQARVDAFFDSESEIEAAARLFAAKQAERDKEKNEKAAAEALDAATKLAVKRAELELKTTQDILSARIALEAEGSAERLALELQLLDAQKAAAIKAFKDVEAETSGIERLFALLADAKRAASTRAIESSVENLGPTHEDLVAGAKAQEEAQLDADKTLLNLRRDLTVEGTKERMRAELAIELAALDEAASAILAKLADGDQRKTELSLAYKRVRLKIAQDEADAEVKITAAANAAKAVTYLQGSGQIAAALAQIFEDNKGIQYASAIINTASGVAGALGTPPYGAAAIIQAAAVAAMGAAQIATIAKTHIGSGSGSSSATIASAPTAQAPQPATINSSPSVASAVSGPISSGPVTQIIQIRYALGDRQAMAKIARQIAAAARNDQGLLR